MLAHQHGTKQIIVVTDGEPTAHVDDYGEVTFNYPPIPETLRRTMAEVIRCTRAGIVINTFALDLQRTHYPFVEQIARVNGGRTFYTTPDALGGYVLVDFLQHRRVLRGRDRRLHLFWTSDLEHAKRIHRAASRKRAAIGRRKACTSAAIGRASGRPG